MDFTGNGFNIKLKNIKFKGDCYELYSTETADQILGQFDTVVAPTADGVHPDFEEVVDFIVNETFEEGHISNLPTIEIELVKKAYGGVGFESSIYRHFLLLRDGEVIDYIKDNRSFHEVYGDTVGKNNGDTLVVIPFEVIKEIKS